MIANPAQIDLIAIAASHAAHIIDCYRDGRIERIASYVAGKEAIQIALELELLGGEYKKLAPQIIEILEDLIATEAGSLPVFV